MPRSHHMSLLLLALALGVASFFLHQSDYPLTYDEGDYHVAVGNGFWTNWTDADDISIFEFARLGMDAVGDPASRARLSDYIRSSGSTMFYRHYHPPLAFYPPILLAPLTGSLPLQWQLRLANLFWLSVWIAVLALLGRRYAEARSPVFVLLPASSAWAMAVVGFNMHLPFGLLASLFFLCWYLYEEHGHTGLKRAALFFLAACFATVEYGMFILFFILIWGIIAFWNSGEKSLFLRRALVAAGWVLLFLAVLWPAGVLGANLFKSWTFVMYIALFRLGAEPVAFAGWWTLLIEKWNANPVELLLLIALVAYALYHWRLLLRRGSLFAATGFILALLYLQVNPALVYRWYLFPAFAVGFVVIGYLVAAAARRGERDERPEGPAQSSPGRKAWDERGRLLTFTATGIVLFAAAWVLVPEPDYSSLKELHRIVDAANPSTLIIPRSVLPQLRPYHPDAEFVSFHDIAYPDMNVQDSIPLWRARGFVLVPKSVNTGEIKPDGSTTEYWYFRQAKTDGPNP